MTLTASNYYSNDANWQYRSKSQYWSFLQCEARALAELKGEYQPNCSLKPLLFGNYLHSYFESKKAHQEFLDEHEKELYKYGNKEKGIKKDFKLADKCIQALANDAGFKALYKGDKEKIVTGNIDGIEWMGKIDCLDLKHKRFYDLKTVDSIHKKHWNNELHEYTDFVIASGYDTQMAIYQELIYQTFGIKCDPLIVAVSKQDTPDKAIIKFGERDLQEALNDVRMKQEHINKVINGEVAPTGCGTCEYCRMNKSLMDMQIETAGQIRLE
ncbi:PD-(D/E)XK nuclease-like domain-containing protein [Apilactobacillus micheneri]|uniref:PD-(D/E)XK nuclease-like domain-containing protein n=1 Tax=Apilactobacillus micheneri TaxID=1899430 RepID=UPI000D02F68F|nr:PD-(D/E)XK nuclease-like domain-containing protein [Apilactobacillus micheneri]